MATKLKFNVMGDPNNNPSLLVTSDGQYTAPNENQLPHRFYYDAKSDSIKDTYEGKSDTEVQQIEHDAAIALALELGLEPPPPLA